MECGGWNVLAADPRSASRLRGTEERSHNLIQHLQDYTCKIHIIQVYFPTNICAMLSCKPLTITVYSNIPKMTSLATFNDVKRF